MTKDADIILKFFSGPHLGAELALLPGRTVVGSGNSCDLIIEDSTVPNRHFVIHVPETQKKPAAIGIEPLDKPLSLILTDGPKENGGPPDRESPGEDNAADPDKPPGILHTEKKITRKADWQPCTLLLAGTTGMAWQFEGMDWEGLAADTIFTRQALPGTDARAEEKARAKTPKPVITVGKWGRRLLRVLGLMLVFAYVFGPCMGDKSTWDARDMRRLLKKNGFKALTVEKTDTGVVISGKVKTREDRERLWQVASGAEYPVFIDVAVEEERAYAVKVALSVRGLFPQVRLEKAAVLMTGYMRDKLIEGASKVWVNQDIPNISKLSSAMVYGSQVWPVLKNRLIFHKLAERVLVRFHPGLVQIEGELDFDQRRTLETVKKEVCDSLKTPVAFWDTLTAPGFSPEWNRSLNAGMTSAFGPDAGLAQLFLDSRSAKGLPVFSAATPALRAKGTAASTPPGRPGQAVLSPSAPAPGYDLEALKEKIKHGEKRRVSKDHDMVILESPTGKPEDRRAVLVDKEGSIVTGPDGKPVLLPPVPGKDGKVLKDKDGRTIFATPETDAQGNLVTAPAPGRTDDQGNLVPGPGGGRQPVLVGPVTDGKGNVVYDREGKPVRGRIARDEKGDIIRDKKGRPVVLGVTLDEDGTPLRDKNGDPIPLVVARDADGNPVYDKDGNPVIVPALVDEKGNLVRDEKGRPVSPVVVTDKDGRAALDSQGRIILDEDANKALIKKYTPQEPGDETGAGAGTLFSLNPGAEAEKLGKDKVLFGSGTSSAGKKEEETREDPLGGLTIMGVNISPLPFVSMAGGQKFFTGGKLPSGYVITKIKTDALTLVRNGKTLIYKMRIER